jgi:hypothetical protein
MSTPTLVRPRRIQRRRTSGSTMPTDAIYVGRGRGDYGKWGNPFRIGEPFTLTRLDGKELSGTVGNPAAAAMLFHWWLPTQPVLLADAREALAGHDVACWCHLDDFCHGDVWLHWANPRSNTPNEEYIDEAGHRRSVISSKRHCNGCGQALGDPTGWEMDCAVAGIGLPDVRPECPTCTPGGPR